MMMMGDSASEELKDLHLKEAAAGCQRLQQMPDYPWFLCLQLTFLVLNSLPGGRVSHG